MVRSALLLAMGGEARSERNTRPKQHMHRDKTMYKIKVTEYELDRNGMPYEGYINIKGVDMVFETLTDACEYVNEYMNMFFATFHTVKIEAVNGTAHVTYNPSIDLTTYYRTNGFVFNFRLRSLFRTFGPHLHGWR